MKKRVMKNILRATAFVLAFFVAIVSVCNILDFKYLDSVFKMKMFYEQEDNTVDVLVLGSSHAYQGINTAVLWKEYGIAAYDLGGAAQPIWNTYYYLVEALKTQTPKAIILDVYTLHYSTDYSEESFAIKNTYGMKWSDTKMEAIHNSFDVSQSGMQFYFPILQYHSRYSDLNKIDFYPYQANKQMYDNHKGFYCYFYAIAIDEPDLSAVTYKNELTEKNNEYYTKILDLAKERNIPVLVTALPFAAENYHQGFFNSAKEIADTYGFEFYNFLTDYKAAAALDYSTDFSDKQHLNYLGGEKITNFFGKILSEKYAVPDRRGDSVYESWEADADVYYKQVENCEIKQNQYLDEYVKVASNSRFKMIITETVGVRGELSQLARLQAVPLFSELGIPAEEYNYGGVWVIENGEVTYYNNGRYPGFGKSVSLGKFDDAYITAHENITEDDETYNTFSIAVNKEDKTTLKNGLNIYVYDTFTQSTVDAAGYNFENGKLSHK